MSQFAPSILKALEARDRAGINAIRDYSRVQSLSEIWSLAAERYGDQLAINDPHNQPSAQLTYRDLWDKIRQFAAGLQRLGLAPANHVALFADNSHRWLIADQGIMAAGESTPFGVPKLKLKSCAILLSIATVWRCFCKT